MRHIHVTLDLPSDGKAIETEISIDVAKEINSIESSNIRAATIIGIFKALDLTGMKLDEFFIVDFRKKMIALNSLFGFEMVLIAKMFLKQYINKVEIRSYIDIDEIWDDFINECKNPL